VALSVSVQVNNTGLANASELVDGVDPAAFTVQSAQSDVGACTTSGSELQCPLGTVNSGNVIGNTIVLVAKAPGTFQLTATTSQLRSPQSLTITVLATTADASVKAPAATLAPKVGGKARAGVLIADGGPLAEHTATVSLTLPSQVKLLAATSQSGTCDVKHLTCRLGAIASGGQTLIVLTFTGAEPGKGQVVIRASGDVTDPATSNNQAAIAINVPEPVKR
jgi:hypothetical protein